MTPRARQIQAAALVIRQDAKLLGIPSVRPQLIEDAVEIAAGKRGMPTANRFPTYDAPTTTAILDALRRAVVAVRVERNRKAA